MSRTWWPAKGKNHQQSCSRRLPRTVKNQRVDPIFQGGKLAGRVSWVLARDTRLLGQRWKTLYSEHNKQHANSMIISIFTSIPLAPKCSRAMWMDTPPQKKPFTCHRLHYGKGTLILGNMNFFIWKSKNAVPLYEEDTIYIFQSFSLYKYFEKKVWNKRQSVPLLQDM